jgi:hypothetical protein
MTIIRFPGSPEICGTTDPDPNHRLAVGQVSFTCTSCDNTTSVDFHNMIFRSLEFYCGTCGNPYRIVNPAFVNITKLK